MPKNTYVPKERPYTEEELRNLPAVLDRYGAARVLNLCPDRVIKSARAGRIPGRLVSGRWRFSTRQLLDYVEGRI